MKYRIIRILLFVCFGILLLPFVLYFIGINPDTIKQLLDKHDTSNHTSSPNQHDYENYLIQKATFHPETIQNLNGFKTVGTIIGSWHIKSEHIGAHRFENSFKFSEPCSDPKNECSSLYLNGVVTIQPNKDNHENMYKGEHGKTRYTPWKLSSIITIKDGTGFSCKGGLAKLVFDDLRNIPFHLTPCPIMAENPTSSFTNPLWTIGIIPLPGDGSFPYTQSSIPDHEIYEEVQGHWSNTERSFLGEEIHRGHYPIAIVKDNRKINIVGDKWDQNTHIQVQNAMEPYHDLDVTASY